MYKKNVYLPVNDNVIDYSVGQKTNFFADTFNSDLLIFTKVYGYRNSFGEQLKNIFKGIFVTILTGNIAYQFFYKKGGTIIIIILDGNFGQILYVNKKNVVGNFKEKKLQRKIANSLKKIIKEE